MKSTLIFIAIIACMTHHAFATVHTITVGPGSAPMTFSPSSIATVHLGDTVKWVWSSGTHTTTSTSVPSGAASWDQQINSGATSYSYVPAAVGTYSYQCTYHASMGMTGSFVVSTLTGVSQVKEANEIFKISPNPVSGTAFMQFVTASSPVTVSVMDVNGKVVITRTYSGVKETGIDLSGLPDGTYILSAAQSGNTGRQKIIVRH